jgi:hypothetical protein
MRRIVYGYKTHVFNENLLGGWDFFVPLAQHHELLGKTQRKLA